MRTYKPHSKKIILLLCIMLGVAALYFAPVLNLRAIKEAVRTEDSELLANLISIEDIKTSLENQALLEMHTAIKRQGTQIDHPDVVKLSHVFKLKIQNAISPALVLQALKDQFTESEILIPHYINASMARVSWNKNEQSHTITLKRDGFSWKLSSLTIISLIPKFWYSPAQLEGILTKDEFLNCCYMGEEKITPFYRLQLLEPTNIYAIDIIETEGETVEGVYQAQISAETDSVKNLIAQLSNRQKVRVNCESLIFGATGHYALPVYCKASSIAPIK